jgi:hypothetical protein
MTKLPIALHREFRLHLRVSIPARSVFLREWWAWVRERDGDYLD